MEDNKTQDNIDTSWSDADISSRTKDSAASASSWGFIGSCGNPNCNDLDDCFISEANSEIINWIVKDYWESLNKRRIESQLDIINKRTGLFIGDKAEKHAALHKACSRLAECYYMELRIEMEDDCCKYISTKILNELKGFSDVSVSKKFEKVDFNTPKSTAIWIEEKEFLQETVQNTLIQRIASLTEAEESWLEKVSKQQYEYFEVLTLMATEGDGCHWIEIRKEDNRLMELIGYIIYKKTHQLAEYSEEELNKIKPIAKKICSQSSTDTINLSCIFIIYQLKSNEVIEPVFKIRNSKDVLFVDINQRVYLSWDDFENNNQLPECLYCYPLRGEYNKKEGFCVTFSWSPASYNSKKVIDVLDVVGKVVTVGSAAALGAAAAFHALPIVAVGGAVAAVTSGAYGINRGISKILDKVSHKQSVSTQNVVNVLSNVVAVASGGVAKVVPAIATLGSSMLFAQSAIQGLTAITTLVPEDEYSIASQSGELLMKTLLFLKSKSPQEAIEKIKDTYDLAPDKPTIFVIKEFVIANSVTSIFMGRVQKYLSKPISSLVMELLDAVEGGIKTNSEVPEDEQILRDIFSYGEFISLDHAFTHASERERREFFKLLMNSVFEISTLCATTVPLRSYRGVEFHPVSEVFEQIDFGLIAKSTFTVDKYLDAMTRKKLQIYVLKILTLICSGEENRSNCSSSLSQYTFLIKTKWPEILTVFDSSKSRKNVMFETS